MKFAIPFLTTILIAGCTVQIRTGPDFAKVVGVAAVTAGMIEYERERSDPAAQPLPELTPDRRISEQDCTQPLDYSLGNIRCK